MLVKVGIAPCEKCGRELTTDEHLGGWYWPAGCSDIHGDGCDGHADGNRARDEWITL